MKKSSYNIHYLKRLYSRPSSGGGGISGDSVIRGGGGYAGSEIQKTTRSESPAIVFQGSPVRLSVETGYPHRRHAGSAFSLLIDVLKYKGDV
ncbi:hypothetical protein B6J66_22165 [Klebsiella quasipneumoniae]|nr:hypothetical protein B6J66_22165 [Klebsiella quasipneumoniae]